MSEQYFLKAQGGERGPFSAQQLEQLLAQGRLRSNRTVREKGSQTWQPVGGVLKRLDQPQQATPDPRLSDGDALSVLESPNPTASPTDACVPPAPETPATPATPATPEGADDDYHLAGDPTEANDQLQVLCPHCQTRLGQYAVLCIHCGYNLKTGRTLPPPSPPTAPHGTVYSQSSLVSQRSSLGTWVSGYGLVILVCMVLGLRVGVSDRWVCFGVSVERQATGVYSLFSSFGGSQQVESREYSFQTGENVLESIDTPNRRYERGGRADDGRPILLVVEKPSALSGIPSLTLAAAAFLIGAWLVVSRSAWWLSFAPPVALTVFLEASSSTALVVCALGVVVCGALLALQVRAAAPLGFFFLTSFALLASAAFVWSIVDVFGLAMAVTSLHLGTVNPLAIILSLAIAVVVFALPSSLLARPVRRLAKEDGYLQTPEY